MNIIFKLLGLLVAGSQLASADGVPIVNASFETPQVAPGHATQNGIPGWTLETLLPQTPSEVAGVANFPASNFVPSSDGSQVGYLVSPDPTFLYQALSTTMAANTTYTLSVDVLSRPGDPCLDSGSCADFSVMFGAQFGSAQARNFCGLTVLKYLSEGTNTLVLNSSNVDPACYGRPLMIEFLGQHNVTAMPAPPRFMDNIRLDALPSVSLSFLHGAFGSWGLIRGETAHLNGLCDGSSPVACQATLEFHDTHGVLLSQSHLTISQGTSGFLDLPAVQDADRGATEVVPVWFVEAGNAVMSFNVLDSQTLRTLHSFNWSAGNASRTGMLDFGPVTLSRADSARTKAYCDGSVRAVCNVTIGFFDANGRMLKESRMTLQPGTAGFADLRYSDAGSTERAVTVRSTINTGEGPVVGSFGVLDVGSGRTTTLTAPASLLSVGR